MTTPVDTPDFVALTATHHGKNQIIASGATVLTPGSSYSSGTVTFNKPGYYFYMTAVAVATMANPFCMISISWRDSASGNILAFEEWVAPIGFPSSLTTRGRGQTKGDEVLIKVTNLDASENVTIHVNFYEASHPADRDDLRSDMDGNFTTLVAGYVAAPCAPLSNTLFAGQPTIAAGVTDTFQLGLYAGQVNVFEMDSGATPLTIIIQPTQLLQTITAITPITQFKGAAAGIAEVAVLPRQPCTVSIANANGVPVPCTLNIGILEYAS